VNISKGPLPEREGEGKEEGGSCRSRGSARGNEAASALSGVPPPTTTIVTRESSSSGGEEEEEEEKEEEKKSGAKKGPPRRPSGPWRPQGPLLAFFASAEVGVEVDSCVVVVIGENTKLLAPPALLLSSSPPPAPPRSERNEGMTAGKESGILCFFVEREKRERERERA
jgi:hypothetical protein